MRRVHRILMGALILSIVWALVFFAAPQLRAQSAENSTTVNVIGSSPIRGDNMPASREEAIADSLVAAVSRVLTDVLPQETMAGNFQVLSEAILEHNDKFISDYRVLTESTYANTYRVMVEATVSIAQLKAAIKKTGIHLGKRNYPRVLLCLAEKQVADSSYRYWWGGQPPIGRSLAAPVVTQKLQEAGFLVVHPQGRTGGLNYPADLNASEAVALAKAMRADVVIVGRADVEVAPNTLGGTIQSYRGVISARAFRADNGEQIAQTQQAALTAASDAETGGREALLNTATLAGDDLAQHIAAAWSSNLSSTAQVEVVVEGTGGQMANFVKFRGALSTMSGVDSVQLKEMRPDAAVLSVAFQGNARALSDALVLQSFDTFGINIFEVGSNTIRLRLVAR